jgi:hypothetical protein
VLGLCTRLHDQHGTENTDDGKTSSLHAHASGAALGAASSVGGRGACVSALGRACGSGGGEDGAVVCVGRVDAVASGARGCARNAGRESRGGGDGHGGVDLGGVAGCGGEAAGRGGGLGASLGGAGGGRGGRGGVGCGCNVSIERVNASRGFAIFRRTDSLAGVLADFLEVLGGGVLVVAAVLGDVAGDLGGVGGADGLDVGRVRALAVDDQFALRGYRAYVKRILLDSSQKACRRSCDCDARGDGQNGEDGGLCEHDVDFLIVCCCLFLGLKGIESRKKWGLKGM